MELDDLSEFREGGFGIDSEGRGAEDSEGIECAGSGGREGNELKEREGNEFEGREDNELEEREDNEPEGRALPNSEKQIVTPPISPFSSPITSIPDFQQREVTTDLKMDTPNN